MLVIYSHPYMESPLKPNFLPPGTFHLQFEYSPLTVYLSQTKSISCAESSFASKDGIDID